MPVPGNSPRAYHFGDFSLDVSRRTLRKGGATVHLTSKPFDVLAFLVENSGRVVTKQELMEAVWRDTFVVEDNLTQAILKHPPHARRRDRPPAVRVDDPARGLPLRGPGGLARFPGTGSCPPGGRGASKA